MPDSLVEKYAKRASEPSCDPSHEPEVIETDLGCFGWLRGVRERALMLELRKKDGHVLALGYAWLERVEYEPEKGITLHTPGRSVTLRGSGLNSECRPQVCLLAGILRHRVPWVRESDRAELVRSAASTPMIERIWWEE